MEQQKKHSDAGKLIGTQSDQNTGQAKEGMSPVSAAVNFLRNEALQMGLKLGLRE